MSADFLLPVSDEPFGVPARTVTVRDSVLAVALFDATYDPTLSSLDALLQSGSLERIRNRALRTALARFPALLEDSNDEERRTRDLVNQRLRPALSRAGNIIAAEIVSWDFHEVSCRSRTSCIRSSICSRQSSTDATPLACAAAHDASTR